MIFTYFIIGLVATIIGAIPPGASNLAVVKTTLEENVQQSLKIAYGAGIGEIVLAFMALSFGMAVQDFFNMHLWIQLSIIVILSIVGLYFLRSRQTGPIPSKKRRSKYLTGFLLSIVNPPVLIYWVVIFSVMSNYATLSVHASINVLALFFTGVFLGKVVTLFGYGKLGLHMQVKRGDKNTNINKIIGGTLLGIASLQVVKLVLF
jgi:threonine/homoserine/homoserine lactone efflux protein